MNRRAFVASTAASVPMAFLPHPTTSRQFQGGSAAAPAPAAGTYKWALASRVWRDALVGPQLSLATYIYRIENPQIAVENFNMWLFDMADHVSSDGYTYVRMLAQGEYDFPPSGEEPRFDACALRTAGANDNGVAVFSLCGNMLSAHYSHVVDETGYWRSQADDLIYQILERMQPFEGDDSRDSLMALLPNESEAAEFGMPVLNFESYTESYTDL